MNQKIKQESVISSEIDINPLPSTGLIRIEVAASIFSETLRDALLFGVVFHFSKIKLRLLTDGDFYLRAACFWIKPVIGNLLLISFFFCLKYEFRNSIYKLISNSHQFLLNSKYLS